MLFLNKELQSKYDIVYQLDKDEKFEYADLYQEIDRVVTAIIELNDNGSTIKVNYSLRLDMERISKAFNKKLPVDIYRQIFRQDKTFKGLVWKIKDIFGVTLADIEKYAEDKKWSEKEIHIIRKQYLQVLYLFYILENVIFTKKVVNIFANPDMDFMDKDNTDFGVFLHVIKKEIESGCAISYIQEVQDKFTRIKDELGTHMEYIKSQYIRNVRQDTVQKMREKMNSICKSLEETSTIQETSYEKNFLHWMYLQICLYEEQCYVKGYLDMYSYDLKERVVQDMYKIPYSMAKMRIPFSLIEEIVQDKEWYHYYFQKPYDEISDIELKKMERIIPKLATYINIVNKHAGNIFNRNVVSYEDRQESSIAVGELVAMIQEILCVDEENPIHYKYYGHHNSAKLSVKRALEFGHGKPLYIIQELVLCRKFMRGMLLLIEDWGETQVEFDKVLGKLNSVMLFDIFSQKNFKDIDGKLEEYNKYLEEFSKNVKKIFLV